MASDRQQFERATARWRRLCSSGALSAPPAVGRTAVLAASSAGDDGSSRWGTGSLRGEGEALARRLSAAGRDVALICDATGTDVVNVIRDPRVASVVVIGCGSLSVLRMSPTEWIDWSIVARSTTHLKQGTFVQRQCGTLSRSLNVPLGLFAVADHRRVHAAVGDATFDPPDLDDPVNTRIRAVFAERSVGYATVMRVAATVPSPDRPVVRSAGGDERQRPRSMAPA